MFQENDKVLCFHGSMLYEAKVLETKEKEGKMYYFIHYKGWKNTWDEWLGEERVLAWDDENLKKQQELVSTATINKNGKRLDPAVQEKKKKRRDSVLSEKEDEFMKRQMIHIPIPDALKLKLVQDWEYVTKSQKLVVLPRLPNVNQVLDGFLMEYMEVLSSKRDKKSASEDIVNEVVQGLKLYFKKALGSILLYKLERVQYLDILKENPSLSSLEVYGAEHLLRLFVQLPMLIAHTNMDVDATNVLKDHLVMILDYMAKNQGEFFLSEYEIAQPSYISRADE